MSIQDMVSRLTELLISQGTRRNNQLRIIETEVIQGAMKIHRRGIITEWERFMQVAESTSRPN